MKSHYNREDLSRSLREAGIRPGDVTIVHSNVGLFGVPEGGPTADVVFDTVFGAFQDVLGTEGTIAVPTFTYSFCRGRPFDPDNTPGETGLFSERLRQQPRAKRSDDPILSVAAFGRLSEELTAHVSQECYGSDSFWGRFSRVNGVICFLNLDLKWCSFNHYVERCLNVPYRFDKLFTGTFVKQGRSEKGGAILYCRDLTNPATLQSADRLNELALETGVLKVVTVGRGHVACIRAGDLYRLIEEGLRADPWMMIVPGMATDSREPIQPAIHEIQAARLPENASMTEMIRTLGPLPRDLVSDGYDQALLALAGQLPMTIHEYPTGTRCWTWIVPEKWTCREAFLERLDGTRVFSYDDHPLHVVSYSLPFDGCVSREELFDHLHVHPWLPDAIPFRFKYYERDWGLCCSESVRSGLTDAAYRVVINSDFSFGAVKVGEIVVPGETEDCFVLCAHLCHPCQVNDGLSGVVVGMHVMKELLNRKKPRYTYRLLILPETIGSLAYLSHHEDLIPRMKGGLFLEMLGLDHPFALQMSFAGDTSVDRCLWQCVRECDPDSWQGAFLTVVGNDERQFNAPGVRVPMLSLSRVLPGTHPQWPFPRYHSSDDTPAACSTPRLEEARDCVLRMVEHVEADRVPVNKFRGEIFCSRFGLHTDWLADPEASRAFWNVMFLIDGTRSVSEIAEAAGTGVSAVRRILAELERHDLIS